MRLRKPVLKGNPGATGGAVRGTAGAVRRLAEELVAVTREMLRIPADLFMRAAELAGAIVLRGWVFVWPLLVQLWGIGRGVVRAAERELTPARGAMAVAAVTAIVLAGSQFADYRAVSIGTADYGDVQTVAPAPEVEADVAGSAHAWLGLPLAAAALVSLAAAVAGRWRAALLLAPIGAAVVGISLLVDVPKGLDESGAAIAYEGASASLLGGFWAQLSAGVVLIVLAPILARLLGPQGTARATAGSRLGWRRLHARGAGG